MASIGKTPCETPYLSVARPFPMQRQVVVFHLMDQAYALPLEELQEILPLAALSRPPRSPALLAGFLNVGGTPIPVIHMRRLFGFPESQLGLYTPLLLLRGTPHRCALLVDQVSQKRSVSEDVFIPLTDSHTFNNCVTDILQTQDMNILLLSTERILHEKERICLGQLQAIEQERLHQLQEVGS